MYTIAGVAVSFGLMIDNAIVMIDYYHQYRNRKIFIALLTSTLSIICALCVVFFLPDQEKRNLSDFSVIAILALASSLLVSFFFTPALYEMMNNSFSIKYRLKKYSDVRNNILRKRKMIDIYLKLIQSLTRHRKAFIIGLILVFGLPIYTLPPRWDGDKFYHKIYNISFGNSYYLENLRPYIVKWLGGSLNFFLEEVRQKGGYRSPEKTKLYINASLPYGNTTAQLNGILLTYEEYLSTIDGIDNYVTNIYSGQQGNIEITFKPEYEDSSLPYKLKSKLVSRSLERGGVNWKIYGVGEGFNQSSLNEFSSSYVTLKGYNYDQLEDQADNLKDKLLRNKRVQDINTNEELGYIEKQNVEIVLSLDALKLSLYNTNQFEIVNNISNISNLGIPIMQMAINNHFYDLILKENEANNYSKYDLLNNVIAMSNHRSLRINSLGKVQQQGITSSIHKENRQYIRYLGFSYLGNPESGTMYLNQILNEFNNEMPIGFSAEKSQYGSDSKSSTYTYTLIFALIAVVFFLCSILFESLKAPLFVISIIPVSFIGIFLSFALGKFYFDQGGYAAFILLGGIVSNSAIFIINDLNNLVKKRRFYPYNKLIIKSVFYRSRTILITTLSNCCGLLPFIIDGQSEIFWFALAVGTLSGLIFSLLATFIILPVFLWRNNEKNLI